MKKYWLSVLCILVVSCVLNYVVHCILLTQAYADTASLWRTTADMNLWLIHAPTLISSLCFVWIYHRFIGNKSMNNAIYYGGIWGIAAGSAMGIGSFAVMPIPGTLAGYWFIAALAQWLIAGCLLGCVYHYRSTHEDVI